MNKWVLLLGCLLAMASQAQSTTSHREIWEWTDANGVKHYSDAPAPGAKRVVITGHAPTAAPASRAPSATTTARPADKSAQVEYSSLEIWSPENGSSFFGADAVVDVRLRSEPELAPNDRLLTYLDGKLIEGGNAYEHSLSNLDRGVHSVTAVILDNKGNEKIRSAPVVFHIKVQTVNNPTNVGPALKPPPSPAPKPVAPGPRG